MEMTCQETAMQQLLTVSQFKQNEISKVRT